MSSPNRAALLPNKYYHVYTRGNNREQLFKNVENYRYFLELWGRHISPIADTFAYCLMGNHIHFLVQIKDEGVLGPKFLEDNRQLSQPFSNCFNAFTKAINKRYSRTGSLFQEGFQRREIIDQEYFIRLIAYIHANPQHHKIMTDFRRYPYSSYKALISKKATKLKREEVWEFFGGREAFIEFHNDHHNWRILSESASTLED